MLSPHDPQAGSSNATNDRAGAAAQQRWRALSWLGRADQGVYLAVAVVFIGAAVAMTVYALVSFISHLDGDFPVALLELINNLLLVLIIMEVFGTVRNYVLTRTTSLRPFLYVGIISAIRRILSIGAETTVTHRAAESEVRLLILDLGVNGLVVLALTVALYLFGRADPVVAGAPPAEAEKEAEEYRG
jgi:uncharacterized membrane protein (DUF373 family)